MLFYELELDCCDKNQSEKWAKQWSSSISVQLSVKHNCSLFLSLTNTNKNSWSLSLSLSLSLSVKYSHTHFHCPKSTAIFSPMFLHHTFSVFNPGLYGDLFASSRFDTIGTQCQSLTTCVCYKRLYTLARTFASYLL